MTPAQDQLVVSPATSSPSLPQPYITTHPECCLQLPTSSAPSRDSLSTFIFASITLRQSAGIAEHHRDVHHHFL